ncbi:sulfotransferase [Aquibaculum sediminis]|uniref:sulfotransferase n=1 Tax=Aquibaculum sediminis TaxID=3231907 RepID=UPI00345673A2
MVKGSEGPRPDSNTPARYRSYMFNYAHDFPGKHFYRGPVADYFFFDSTLKVSGWVVPDSSAEFQKIDLQLQVIQGGRILQRIPITFTSSPDVSDRFTTIEQAENARYAISVRLTFLKSTEYVLRLVLILDNKLPERLWDIALLKDEVRTKPLFVVGSPRAGTTAVGNALRTTLGAKNYGEHHFLFLVKQIEDTVNKFFSTYHTRKDYGTFIYDISPALLIIKLGQQVKDLYASWQPGAYFVDKTPGRNMLLSVPTIRMIWPEAKFIFCKRSPYKNIVSRLAKFPHLSLEEHAQQWVEVMEIWGRIKEKIEENCYIEVDQNDITNNPSRVSDALAAFLGEKIAGNLERYFNEHSPERSTQQYTTLGDKDIERIYSICGGEMEKWGYVE